jgi:hypothetical protein
MSSGRTFLMAFYGQTAHQRIALDSQKGSLQCISNTSQIRGLADWLDAARTGKLQSHSNFKLFHPLYDIWLLVKRCFVTKQRQTDRCGLEMVPKSGTEKPLRQVEASYD